MAIQRLRGFKDIYGSEAELFAKAESAARKIFGNFGFEEIKIPILEEKELFTKALGTETDVVQKEMYEFTDRSKIAVAMRPEGTAGVVRAYLENGFDKSQGHAKFYYAGPMFRSERPQAGRLRQFHQIGVEQLGTDSPYADAETIQCLTVFLDAAGAGGYGLKLNNLGTFDERKKFREELKKYFTPKKSQLCEDCQNRLEKNVFRILDCKNEACRAIIRHSPPITGFLTPESVQHFEIVQEALRSAGVAFTIDPYMIRGLDYYTKTVFEVTHPALGAQDALAAGGRYDGLIESFGGAKSGAVGFAIGVERLLMSMKPVEISGELSENSYFIVTLGEAAFKEGFAVLSYLRKKGVTVSMDFAAKSMKSQMRSADRSKCRTVMILGDDELKNKTFVLKDMKTGEQKTLPVSESEKIFKC